MQLSGERYFIVLNRESCSAELQIKDEFRIDREGKKDTCWKWAELRAKSNMVEDFAQ